MMMLFKGILISMAGPAPNYDMQRILATRKPSDAAKMSGFVTVVLFFPRYMMISGLTVLALVFFSPELNAMGADIDFEMILPYAIKNFVPVGLMGVLMAGLLAAFMSTFAATVNAAPAYIVNDIYKRFIRPDADKKTYVRMSYIFSFLVVVIGIAFGFAAESINTVTLWIVSALWGGYTASNLLKWHWWRFNGYGYFWGMVLGILASMLLPLILPEVLPLYIFPFILLLSLAGCIIGSLTTAPDEERVLKEFYRRVRPWGFWDPIYKLVIQEDPDFKRNTDFRRDMFNIVAGIIWQTSLIAIPIYIVIQEKVPILTGILILIITSLILKKTWYDKLKDADQHDVLFSYKNETTEASERRIMTN
jgi:Na+/proline symporter